MAETQEDDEDGEIGRHEARAVEHAPVEAMMLGGFGTEHEIDAADEDGEGVGDVEQGGVEDGLSAEDGGCHGVADEADVAEHEHEAVHAA